MLCRIVAAIGIAFFVSKYRVVAAINASNADLFVITSLTNASKLRWLRCWAVEGWELTTASLWVRKWGWDEGWRGEG